MVPLKEELAYAEIFGKTSLSFKEIHSEER